jgi:hypothetical protein
MAIPVKPTMRAIPVKPAVKAFAVLYSIPMVPVRDMNGRTPMAACPNPTVIMPSPIAADPDVTRSRADRHGFHDRCREWRRLTHRRWGYHDRSRNRNRWNGKRDSEVDSEVNSSVYSGDSHSRQSQNCNSLFHNHY